MGRAIGEDASCILLTSLGRGLTGLTKGSRRKEVMGVLLTAYWEKAVAVGNGLASGEVSDKGKPAWGGLCDMTLAALVGEWYVDGEGRCA
jgi:hypothetical protein